MPKLAARSTASAIAIPAWLRPVARRPELSTLAQVRSPKAFLSGPEARLPEQPYDAELLCLSPLYRRSRRLFREAGGEFRAALLSSPRSLSSVSLVSSRIEYSPVESELRWTATDPGERGRPERLLELRTYCTSIFHEQSHRILWPLLPPPPADRAGLRRYLNLAESLVILADWALGDSLGPKLARPFYLAGVTYDPGTSALARTKSRREYRNYLQAGMQATYLYLEGFVPADIAKVVPHLFPAVPSARPAVDRATALDPLFVERTNPLWQARHWKTVRAALARPGQAPLELPDDPLANHQHYLWGERWMDLLGI